MEPDALLDDLDADQRVAVTAPGRLVAVVAGAGSGKTRVLTRRIAHRIATGDADARHTLALTFTREAAGELRRRLVRLGLRDHIEAGTFHSVMLSILRQRWEDTGRRPKTVSPDRRRILRDAAGGDRLDAVLAEIDWATARGIEPSEFAGQARRIGRRPAGGIDRTAEAFAAFTDLKRRRGVIDFDDVLSEVVREARRDAEFAATLRWRFRHLLVDEAQDLNPLQHRVIDLLRQGRDDLYLVGDPAQSIYGFNGADAGALVDVAERYPGVEVIRLPVNHRCTPQIVGAGLHVLRSGGQGHELRSARPDGPTVALLSGDDEDGEAALIATEVARRDQNLVRSGEVAVLARTHAQLGVIETALTARGVPVRRSATAAGSPLQEATQTAAALTSSSQLRAWAHDVLEDVDALNTAEAIVATVERPDSRASAPDRRAARRALDVIAAERKVAAAVLDYVRDQPMGNGAGFRSWVATTNPFRDRSREGVELLTFHASKGREWHTVIVTGVETGLVPHRTATTVAERAEEARLLYVALTRATDDLVVTHADRRGGYRRTISPLIADLDVGRTDVIAPPPELLTARVRRGGDNDETSDALHAWRSDAARRANVLPTELCTDRDLEAIARSRPATAEELADVTSMGLITARRLAPQLLPLLHH